MEERGTRLEVGSMIKRLSQESSREMMVALDEDRTLEEERGRD